MGDFPVCTAQELEQLKTRAENGKNSLQAAVAEVSWAL